MGLLIKCCYWLFGRGARRRGHKEHTDLSSLFIWIKKPDNAHKTHTDLAVGAVESSATQAVARIAVGVILILALVG